MSITETTVFQDLVNRPGNVSIFFSWRTGIHTTMADTSEDFVAVVLAVTSDADSKVLPKDVEAALLAANGDSADVIFDGMLEMASKGNIRASYMGLILEYFESVLGNDADKSVKRPRSARIIGPLLALLQEHNSLHSVGVFEAAVRVATLTFTEVFSEVLEMKEGYEKHWQQLTELREVIEAKWATNYPINDQASELGQMIGVKLSIIKYIGVVLHVFIGAPPRDPRKRERNPVVEVSVTMAKNHPLITNDLKDVGLRLLQQLLDVVCDESVMVSQLNNGIFYVLIGLVKKRPSVINTVLTGLGTYDSSKHVILKESLIDDPYATLKDKLTRRFSDRSFKVLLNFLFKNNILVSASRNTTDDPQDVSNKYYNKISTIILYQDKQRTAKNLTIDLPEDLAHYKFLKRYKQEKEREQVLQEVLQVSGLSRPEVDEYQKHFPNLGYQEYITASSSSYDKLFQLTDNDLTKFDANLLNTDILTQLIMLGLNNTSKEALAAGLSIVGSRYKNISENGSNKRIKLETNGAVTDNSNLDFILPPPVKFTAEQKKDHIKYIISNFLNLSQSKELRTFVANQEDLVAKPTAEEEARLKISKIAITKWEKNSWGVILIRLATRGLSGNEELADLVRDGLFRFFLENIHSRIDVVIEWLNEEWYSEYVKEEAAIVESQPDLAEAEVFAQVDTPTYIFWTGKIIDAIIPFLELKDRKIFIRLLSDLPYLNKEIISKLKPLCSDALRFALGVQSLQYLIMFRPPVKQACIEILEDLKLTANEDNQDMIASVDKLLTKYK